jgi:hypothetical protein
MRQTYRIFEQVDNLPVGKFFDLASDNATMQFPHFHEPQEDRQEAQSN